VKTELVPVAPSEQECSSTPASGRCNADFIAHLVATKNQAPQTRLRRRAEPAEAIAAYSALGQWPMPSGRALSRSL
jgi:hypothetical protein